MPRGPKVHSFTHFSVTDAVKDAAEFWRKQARTVYLNPKYFAGSAATKEDFAILDEAGAVFASDAADSPVSLALARAVRAPRDDLRFGAHAFLVGAEK